MNAIETEFFKHIKVADQATCQKDMETAYTDIMKLVTDVNKKASKFTLLGDAEKAMADISPLLTDCKPV